MDQDEGASEKAQAQAQASLQVQAEVQTQAQLQASLQAQADSQAQAQLQAYLEVQAEAQAQLQAHQAEAQQPQALGHGQILLQVQLQGLPEAMTLQELHSIPVNLLPDVFKFNILDM